MDAIGDYFERCSTFFMRPVVQAHTSVPRMIVDDAIAPASTEAAQLPQTHGNEAQDRVGRSAGAKVKEWDWDSHLSVPHGPPVPGKTKEPQDGIPSQSASQNTAHLKRRNQSLKAQSQKRRLPRKEEIPEAEASSSAERRKRQRT